MIPAHILREYDIRGEVDKDLTERVVEEIGRAFSTYLLRNLKTPVPSTRRRTVTVGRDVRLHSQRMKEALVRGINSTGVDVIDIGVCPTPLTYFSIFHFSTPTCTEIPPSLPEYGSLEILGGVMITGSHNPPEFNGFKLCQGKAALYGEAIREVGRIAGEGAPGARGRGSEGKTISYEIIPPYLDYLRSQFVARPSTPATRYPLKVVVDSGNGTAGVVAPGILREMGCEVTELYSEPDGRFPNHHPDPSVLKNLTDLVATVKQKGAHLGIAYDGDADRIGVIDEKGEVIWGDRLMVIFARDILKAQPGATMISEVKASQVLYDDISRAGGKPIMWKAGHSLIKAKMKETGAVLGGEVSGHIFFADRFFGYDDAIYATCRLVEILQKTLPHGGEKETAPWGVSHLLRDLPETVVTPEIRVSCPDDRKFQVVERLRELFHRDIRHPAPETPFLKDLVTVDGVRVIFDHGWGLVRPSNTQPVLVLRFEADTEERLHTYRTYVETRLRGLTSFSEQEH